MRSDAEIIKEQRELLLAAYQSGHREGWEDGPSVSEVMDRLHDHLCNAGVLKRAKDTNVKLADWEVIRFIHSQDCAAVEKRETHWHVRLYGSGEPFLGETLADAVRAAMTYVNRKG